MREEKNINNEKSDESLDVSKKLTLLLKHFFKGSVIGATEVAIDHPLWTIKTRIQRGDNFTLSPRILYRGVHVNMFSMVPITAIQVATATALQELINKNNKNENMFSYQFKGITSAFVGGMISSIVSTPTELIITHMKDKQGFKLTALKFIRHYGASHLYVGSVGTAMRDGIFTVGFFTAPSIIENKLKFYMPNYNFATSIISDPIAGTLAALVSHPFDTIKTKQQVYANEKKVSFLTASKDIIKKEGIFNLYKGFIPRASRVISAITIMDQAGKQLDKHLNIRRS